MRTFDELFDRFQAAVAVEKRIEGRMFQCVPGSSEGQRWHGLLVQAQRKVSTRQRELRAHPDYKDRMGY